MPLIPLERIDLILVLTIVDTFCWFFIEDLERGIVPTTFPGSLVLTDKGLHNDYRRYKYDYNNKFEYFISRLAERISWPGQTKYTQKKTTTRMSNIFTILDEAYVLLVLHNELDHWTDQVEKKKKDDM